MEHSDFKEFSALVRSKLRKSIAGCYGWTLAYHVTVYGATLSSAAAGYLTTIKDGPTDVIRVCAFLAAILSAVAGIGDFKRKWQSNRQTRTKLELLIVDLTPSGNLEAMKTSFKAILQEHDAAIVGGTPTPAKD
ncbi:hypothetical protein [Burkholderia ubonensis]|uniref:hypothetical protein n=1 Tax=Burkholderia ubonensis TaxID=101571 RepID=UPI000A7B80BE|nr:hypothetical protein [Burkholderia ubonensis]